MLFIGCFLFFVCLISVPVLSFSQEHDSLFREVEKNQAKNNNEKLYAQIKQVDESLLSGTLDFSLADNIRYVAIKMAYFNAMGEVENGLALADSLENIPAYKSIPEEAWASVIYRKANIFLNQEKMLESSRSYQRAIQLF